MQYVFEGILLGLTLTILLGPIFVALTQTGIKHGIRAGISVGTGIWTSDLLVIFTAWFSYLFSTNMKKIKQPKHLMQKHIWVTGPRVLLSIF